MFSVKLTTVLLTSRRFVPLATTSLSSHCLCYNRLHQPLIPTVNQTRSYAKSKDRKKEPKGKKSVVVDETLLAEVINLEKFQSELDKQLNQMKDEFVKHLTLRSAAGAMDSIPVSFEGKSYTLQELAQIVKKNPKTIVVKISTFPQAIPDIIKAIENSGLGLNPQQDGTTLFINVPKITKEHRETLAKNAKAIFIKHRDLIKDVQNKFIKQAKNKEGVAEDVFFCAKEQITLMAEKQLGEADGLLKTKQTELLGDK